MDPREPAGAETPEGEGSPGAEPSGAPAEPTATPTPTPTATATPTATVRKSGLGFFSLLLLLFFPGIVAQAIHLPLGLLWTQLFAFLLPALLLSTGSSLDPRAFLRLAPARPALLGLGFLAGLGGYLLAVGVMGLARELMPERWLELFDAARVFEGSTAFRVAVALVAALVAPVCEEIAFRGYLMSALSTRRGPAATVAGSTILFALMHLDPVRFPALLVLGGVFGWLAWRAGSVWPAVAAHAANNALVSGLVLAGVAAPDEAAELPDLAMRVRGALVAAALGGAMLWPLLRAFAGVAAEGPAPGSPIALRDASNPSGRFSLRRVPAPLHAAVILGLAALLALAVAARMG